MEEFRIAVRCTSDSEMLALLRVLAAHGYYIDGRERSDSDLITLVWQNSNNRWDTFAFFIREHGRTYELYRRRSLDYLGNSVEKINLATSMLDEVIVRLYEGINSFHHEENCFPRARARELR